MLDGIITVLLGYGGSTVTASPSTTPSWPVNLVKYGIKNDSHGFNGGDGSGDGFDGFGNSLFGARPLKKLKRNTGRPMVDGGAYLLGPPPSCWTSRAASIFLGIPPDIYIVTIIYFQRYLLLNY